MKSILISLCLGCLLLTACSEPAIRVDFDIPEAYGNLVASTSLGILTASDPALFNCDAMALGEIDEEALRLSLIKEVGGGGEMSFVGIPRSGGKLFFAQGFNTSGEPVVAACQEVDSISDGTRVDLQAEPVAIVGLVDDSGPVQLQLTDVRREPLAGREVSYQITGPAESGSAGSLTSDAQGSVVLNPQIPEPVGPWVLTIRTRWQRGEPLVLNGFVRPEALTVELPDLFFISVQVGRIGPAGEAGFVGLTVGVASDFALVYQYYHPASGQMQGGQVDLGFPLGPLPVVGIAPSTGRDRVVVLNPPDWLELDPAAGQLETVAGPLNIVPLTIFAAGDCSQPSADGPLLVQAMMGSPSRVFDSDGQPQPSHPLDGVQPFAALIASGCVSDQEGTRRRVLIAKEQDQANFEVLAVLDDRVASVRWQGFLGQMAFLPALTGDAEALLLASQIGADGPEIARLRILLDADGNSFELEELSRDPALAAPVALAGGNLDDDARGQVDMAALVPVADSMGLFDIFVQVILGRETGSRRVSGILSHGRDEGPFRLFAIDVDGDSIDDLLVHTQHQPHNQEQPENHMQILLMGQASD